MSKILQTNGDFVVKTRSLSGDPNVPADIILDPSPGNIVRVTGTLIVEGQSISVAAEDLTIEDNFIVINSGETGAGVTLQTAGLQVDRGTLPPANIIWDENIQAWTFATGQEGSLNHQNNNVVLKQILTNPGIDSGNLTLIGSGTGVMSVAGTTDYELNVTDDDDIPNKKYVDTQIVDAPGHNIKADDTYVYIADSDIVSGPGSVPYFNTATSQYTENDESAVSIIVDGNLNTQYYADKVVTQNLEIRRDGSYTAVLANKNEGSNLYFKTNSTGKLQTNYAIQLDQHSAIPAYTPGSILIYADVPKHGNTGIFFVNDKQDTATNNASRYRNDELISRKKALLYSMIF